MQTRWLILLIWASIVNFAGACAQSADDVPRKTGQLTGVVRWADERPLVDPRVKLHRYDYTLYRWKGAERQADVSAEGKFAFHDVSTDEYWCVSVRARGAGVTFRQTSVEEGKPTNVTVTLKPLVNSFVTVRDEQGKPLAGARIRSLDLIDGAEGRGYALRGSEASLELPVTVSDSEGRLDLPNLPEGVTLSVVIDHPQFAASRLAPESPLKNGEFGTCQLSPGIPLQIKLVHPDGLPFSDLSEVALRCWPSDTRHPDMVQMPFHIDQGNVEHRIRPGEFRLLEVRSEQYLFTPWVYNKANKTMPIAAGQNDTWKFRALSKVLVRGRVLKENGQPAVGMGLAGQIDNLLADGTKPPADWYPWVSTEFVETNQYGEYQIHLAQGHGRIVYSGDGIPSADHLDVMIQGAKEQQVPDIIVRDLPTIRGTVFNPHGQPAARTLVRAFSDSALRLMPILTDDAGKFEIPLTTMPTHRETEARMYEHQVYAFSPYESIGGVATIDLRNEESVGRVTIQMTKRPVEWPLSEMRPAFSPWERGEPDAQLRQERITSENAVGSVVPELDGALWLNTDRRSLAEFRGQFVFLDFYTTWCGPCRADFPTVKLVHDLYRDHGLTVIGVHDNSSAHDVIREHAAEQHMEMPIIVDHEDGRTLKAYERQWLARGYPSYVLLDPTGRLVTSDRCTPGPTLRGYKLEVVRQTLLQHQLANK